MSGRKELTLTEDDVRAEHEAAVDPSRHWAYLAGVLLGSLALMLLLIAALGGSGG